MRAFIALPLPGDIKEELCRCRDALRQRALSGRAARRENLHLTLAFLGEIPLEAVPQAAEALRLAVGPPFSLCLSGLGCFASQEGDIWWAAVGESAPLRALERRLRRNLTAAGFSLPQRPFVPHLTLGRALRLPADFDPETIALRPLAWTVTEAALFSSAGENGRRVYTPVSRAGLPPAAGEKIQ